MEFETLARVKTKMNYCIQFNYFNKIIVENVVKLEAINEEIIQKITKYLISITKHVRYGCIFFIKKENKKT